jgi:hypothetical protein
MRTTLLRLACVTALVGGLVAVAMPGNANDKEEIEFHLVPSSPDIAACFPDLKAEVEIELETEAKGRDELELKVEGAPANQELTVFLLEMPGSPFGAAQYSGDVITDSQGRGRNEFELIVEEAFASTLVNGQRVRAELNHVGFWFADPAADDVCFGPGGGAVTPFDGDGTASVQIMNSANFLPGAPIP